VNTTILEAEPVLDREAAELIRAVGPLMPMELRYLRKAVRYRLGLRGSIPSRYLAGGYLRRARTDELDRLADWIVQAGA
jgi:hypothetical protein